MVEACSELVGLVGGHAQLTLMQSDRVDCCVISFLDMLHECVLVGILLLQINSLLRIGGCLLLQFGNPPVTPQQ